MIRFIMKGILLVVCFTAPGNELYAQSRSAEKVDVSDELRERINLFEKARQYLQQDNPDELRQLQGEVEETFAYFDTWQQSRQSIARGIRVRTGSDEEINRLANSFMKAAMKAESGRSGLRLAWPLFIETRRNAEEFAKKVEKFIKTHRTLFEKAGKMYENRSAVSLPTLSGLYGPDKIKLTANRRCDAEFMIENNGTRGLQDIELRVETASGQAVEKIWCEPGQIATVAPGKAAKFKLCTRGTSSEQNLVMLMVESEEMSKVKTLRVLGPQ